MRWRMRWMSGILLSKRQKKVMIIPFMMKNFRLMDGGVYEVQNRR